METATAKANPGFPRPLRPRLPRRAGASARPLLPLMAAAWCMAAAAAKEPVKLVAVGSYMPPLDELAAHAEYYEAQAPFDGVTYILGFSCDLFNPKPLESWQKPYDEDKAAKFASIKFQHWKYNFLGTLIDQNKPNFFDDAEWANIAARFAHAARIARQAGMVGICFDPEGYGVYPVQSYWESGWWVKGGGKLKSGGIQPPDFKHSEEDYRKIARKRGQDVGRAMFAEYPGLVFWGFYLWSFGGDLLAEFTNGMLEVAPPKARVIDGDEWQGYCAKDSKAYRRMVRRNENGCGMLDKRLRAKQKAQGGVAFSFYLDAYADPDGACLAPNIKNEKNPVKYFKGNLKDAKRMATGGFLWIYGEGHTFWTPPPGSAVPDRRKAVPHWETVLPGLTNALFRESQAFSPAWEPRSAAMARQGGKAEEEDEEEKDGGAQATSAPARRKTPAWEEEVEHSTFTLPPPPPNAPAWQEAEEWREEAIRQEEMARKTASAREEAARERAFAREEAAQMAARPAAAKGDEGLEAAPDWKPKGTEKEAAPKDTQKTASGAAPTAPPAVRPHARRSAEPAGKRSPR